jgi:CheY-like chemotaxis protein
VLQFVSAQLVSLGYGVTAVSTGPDALELLQAGGRFDLLFSDVVLPKGMSGVELVRRARALCPQMRVLLTSGYAEEAFEHHGRPEPDTTILRKPYRRKELERTVRAVLDQPVAEAPRMQGPPRAASEEPPSAQILELRARDRSPRLGGGRG